MITCSFIVLSPSDACELTVDSNTVHRNLRLSANNRKVESVRDSQSYGYHGDRFEHWRQLLCRDGLTGYGYWEVEWEGKVHIAVAYKGIRRKGRGHDSRFGENDQSWSLSCSHDGGLSVCHNKERVELRCDSGANRLAVFVDCAAGLMCVYRVCSGSLVHIHTFKTRFTEPVYPGFWVLSSSSLTLCSL